MLFQLGMPIDSREFSQNMQNFLRQNMRENMQNLAYAAYMWHIFSAYFRHMQIRVTKNHNRNHE